MIPILFVAQVVVKAIDYLLVGNRLKAFANDTKEERYCDRQTLTK